MQRDPRVDPKRGDVMRAPGGWRFLVLSNDGHTVEYAESTDLEIQSVPIAAWIRNSKGDVVERREVDGEGR